MKKRRSKSFFKIFCLLAVVSAVMVIGCKKKSPSPTGGQVQQDADFQTSPGVVICDLKKVKLDKMDLPNDQPYFIRDMERNSKDTLLKGELAIEGKEYTVILPYESRWEQMALYETAKKQSPSWWGADDLNSIHKINGKYYEFSTLEGKSKFAARLYAGDTGVFKVG
ncbi:MAG: hypothetical protein ACYSUT_09865, partial [Planctomycetota bacterium]